MRRSSLIFISSIRSRSNSIWWKATTTEYEHLSRLSNKLNCSWFKLSRTHRQSRTATLWKFFWSQSGTRSPHALKKHTQTCLLAKFRDCCIFHLTKNYRWMKSILSHFFNYNLVVFIEAQLGLWPETDQFPSWSCERQYSIERCHENDARLCLRSGNDHLKFTWYFITITATCISRKQQILNKASLEQNLA